MRTPSALFLALIAMAVVPGGSPGVAAGPEDDDLARQLPRIAPSTPAESLARLRVRPGLRVLQVAAEPLVADPVAACYDAEGRLYVVEMRGYPFPEDRPTGAVKRLVDADGDGVFESATAFLSGLNWPTSVLPHDGGVFVACAPDLIYARDDDGDGVADTKKIMFTGFGTQNVQQLLNGLCRGLDGWVYGAAAGNGGEVRDPSRPGAPAVAIRGRDFRFRPDGSAFEAISGGGQFGHVFDDWGRRFVCNNRWHARQIALPARYLANNPDLVAPAVIADIAADGNEAPVYRISPPEPWRVVRSKQYEAKMQADPVFARRLPNAERHPAGFFSSASGMTLYRGSALPEEYRGNAFVCDVAGNLVHRKRLVPAGAIFRAERAEPGVEAEFLASPEIWFRPVNLANTPDGTLLVLDMAREAIEHPLSIPDDIKAHLDLKSGDTRGRIYEVVPEGFKRKPRPRLAGRPAVELVPYLGHPDAWTRETAQRLIVERGADGAAVGAIRALAQAPATPLARLHALWTLENLGRLDVATLLLGFEDPAPGVRENAARLAEDRAGAEPALASAILGLADDPDPMTRFQAAFSIGFVAAPEAVPALARIARRDAEDPWTRTAVLTAVRGRALPLLRELGCDPRFFEGAAGLAWFEAIAELIGASGSPEGRAGLLEAYLTPEARPALARALVLGLGRGLRRAGGRPESLAEGPYRDRLDALLARAAASARDEAGSVAERVDAVRLLAMGPADRVVGTLPDLLDAKEAPELQVEALRALGASAHPDVAPLVIGRWGSLSPNVRREAAEVLLARPDRVAALLDAIEARRVAPGDLDPARRAELASHPDAPLRDRAARLLGAATGGDRAAVIAAYRPALERPGDADRGRLVFRKVCATCHKVGGEGHEVGPNLATVAAKPPEELAVQVLDPNREVAPAFVNYSVATRDGRLVSGVVAEETATAVTLRRAEGVTEVLPRGQIEAIRATGLSLMPEGLEQSVSPGDLADVIAFLRSLAPAPATAR